MDEKQRLLNTLFRNKKERTLNVKFCRGTSEEISPEEFCKEVNGVLMQIRTGMVTGSNHFAEEFHSVNVAEFVSAL